MNCLKEECNFFSEKKREENVLVNEGILWESL